MIKAFAPYLRKYKIPAILCPILMLFEVIAEVLMPILMARIIDIGVKNQDVTFIVRTGLLMIGLAFFALICGAASARLSAIASQGFGAEVRQAVFDRIQDFSFSNLDRFSIPSLITRLTNDVRNLQMAVMMILRMLVRAPFMMLLALMMAILINSQLAIVFLVAIPILSLSLALILSHAYPRFRNMQRKIDRLNMFIQENLISIRVVKAFVRSDHEKERFRKANDELKASAIHAIQLVILNMPVMQLIMYACILAILWFGGMMVAAGGMETGQLISFVSYVTQILMSLMMLSMLFLMLTRAKASGERVNEVLKTDIDLTSPDHGHSKVPDGSIEMQNVYFSYPVHESREDDLFDRDKPKPESDTPVAAVPVLHDVNFRVKSGEIIGLIGSTGSGKTSLVQLIPRLYDADSGRVLVGGNDVRDYDLSALRQDVAMVLQNNTLFTGSIRDNLRWGNETADDEKIREACETAQAWSFIQEMPDGLDTQLGQGGVNVSGGQKQRLCIARALLKEPKILILDDSTSAVDMATDAKIRRALSTRLSGITTLIIAQRIRSVQQADRIIVLDEGRIQAIGTHEQLLAENEIYRDIYSVQQEGAIAG